MKCEKCGNDYPSKYYFKTPTICNECFDKLNPEERKIAHEVAENNISGKKRYFAALGRWVVISILIVVVIAIAFTIFKFASKYYVIQQHSERAINNIKVNQLNFLTNKDIDMIYNYAKYFPNNTELSIALIHGNKEDFIGIKRQNDTLFFVDNRDKIFNIGSITKVFTSAILAKFVLDNTLTLKQPIKNLLPIALKQSSLNGKELTLLNLANHTSGLPHIPLNIRIKMTFKKDPFKEYDKEKFYKYLKGKLKIKSTPGEKYLYSNTGFALIAHILSIRFNKSYDDLLTQIICDPLNMTNTAVNLSETQKQKLVEARDLKGRIIPEYELNMFVGAGGIKSNAIDLVKFRRGIWICRCSACHAFLLFFTF